MPGQGVAMVRSSGESIATPKLPIGLWRYSWCIHGQNIFVNTSARQTRIAKLSNASTVKWLASRRCSIFSMRIPQNHSR